MLENLPTSSAPRRLMGGIDSFPKVTRSAGEKDTREKEAFFPSLFLPRAFADRAPLLLVLLFSSLVSHLEFGALLGVGRGTFCAVPPFLTVNGHAADPNITHLGKNGTRTWENGGKNKKKKFFSHTVHLLYEFTDSLITIGAGKKRMCQSRFQDKRRDPYQFGRASNSCIRRRSSPIGSTNDSLGLLPIRMFFFFFPAG